MVNKKIVFFIGALVIQSHNARYPGIRIVKDATPKKIIFINNTTDQKIFLRLKPTHVHPTCDSCNEMAYHQEEIDDCCKSIKTVEYSIPEHTKQLINLATINVGSPDDNANKEYLDFSGVIYAKIYNASRTHYTYITLENNRCYTILPATNSTLSVE